MLSPRDRAKVADWFADVMPTRAGDVDAAIESSLRYFRSEGRRSASWADAVIHNIETLENRERQRNGDPPLQSRARSRRLRRAVEAIERGEDPNAPSVVEEPDESLTERPRTYALSDVQARPTDFLFHPYIPRGEVVQLVGDPGRSKTLLALDLAARVSTGEPMPLSSVPTEPGCVLFLSAEDDPARTLRPRLEAAGADLERVHVWGAAQLPTLPSGAEELARVVESLGATLLVFDPIVAFLDDDKSAHIDGDVRTSLRLLHALCSERDATALLIQHLNKQPGGNALYRIGGSVGWIAMARSALLVGEHPQDPQRRVVAHLKSNLAPRGPSLAYALEPVEVAGAGEHVRIQWLGEVDLKAGDLLRPEPAEPREAAASPLQGEIKALVCERLAGGSQPAKDVLDWLADGGFKSRSIDAATAELVRDGLLRKYPTGAGGAWVWEWRGPDSAAPSYPLRSVETAESADSTPRDGQSPRSPRYSQSPRGRGGVAETALRTLPEPEPGESLL